MGNAVPASKRWQRPTDRIGFHPRDANIVIVESFSWKEGAPHSTSTQKGKGDGERIRLSLLGE